MVRRGITWLEVGVIILITLILSAVLFPIFAQDRGSHFNQCLSNIKQLATSTSIYVSDFDDKFPMRKWHDAIWEYTQNESVYSCPQVLAQGKVGGYAYNVRVMGKKMSKLQEPNLRVLFFETGTLGLNQTLSLSELLRVPRYGTRITISYTDTSVRSIAPGGAPLPFQAAR